MTTQKPGRKGHTTPAHHLEQALLQATTASGSMPELITRCARAAEMAPTNGKRVLQMRRAMELYDVASAQLAAAGAHLKAAIDADNATDARAND